MPIAKLGRGVRAAGRLTETQIQRAVVLHLRQRGVPGLVFCHCPNGGYRRPTEAAIFKALGVRAGVADLLLWHDGKSFALELKAPGGRPTEAQLAFLADFDEQGGFTAITDDLDRALATLTAWGLLRGKPG
ncbi:hypothetical protein BKD09_07445 [Bradyrhizobium japonicum]|uniref:VRR-NUC domain-containing protein n=1 Tax=Bradyrhizobium japonicum TaxID=375 RepID=A0A1L3F4C7_BRAJP|nr:VRR-NUC domain-containing protein [Bradyrhizobium japonicum]APG08158.1 hypothetical protein BKD09_07445 [Bradyrhizobium japonicum]